MESEKSLELICSDIYRLIILFFNGGKIYIITFIDDYRKIWVHFLQDNSKLLKPIKGIKHLLRMKLTNQ
jgi:hypothetical protein